VLLIVSKKSIPKKDLKDFSKEICPMFTDLWEVP
jgi:hypothetical protein